MSSSQSLFEGEWSAAAADVPTSPRYRWTVHLVGELDVATAPRARSRLSEVLNLGCGSVAVDLSALEFIDASGIRILREAHKVARQQGRDLLLVGVAPRIQRLLEILGLSELIDRYSVRPEVPPSGAGSWHRGPNWGRLPKNCRPSVVTGFRGP